MNKTMAVITAVVTALNLLVLVFFVGLFVGKGIAQNNVYSINAEVIDRRGDEIFIEDFRGEIWSFNSELAWENGDKVTVIFDTVETDSILDDKIISVDWLGQWEG